MNQDTLPIIFSYLKPVDLVSVLQVDHFFSERVRLYFFSCCKSFSIEEYICPHCSWWLTVEKEKVEKEKQQLVDMTLSFKNLQSSLFCKECSDKYYTNTNALSYPYQGYRRYYIFTYYNTSFFPWSIIYYTDKNKLKKWEEIECYSDNTYEYEFE